MSSTSPRAQVQRIGDTCVRHWVIASPVSLPTRCDPGSTRTGPCFLSAVVEVHTDGEHPLKERDWGLHMDHAGFRGPRPKPWGHVLRLYGNSHVLMPGDLPICLGRFVEHETTDSEAVEAQQRFHQGAYALGTGQLLHFRERMVEAKGRGTPVMLAGALVCHTDQRVEKRPPEVVGYHACNYSKPLLVDEISILHRRF